MKKRKILVLLLAFILLCLPVCGCSTEKEPTISPQEWLSAIANYNNPEAETVYWRTGHTSYHVDPFCYRLVYAPVLCCGSPEDAALAGAKNPCAICG